ncbi:hypothetical protein GWI33_022067 [Rhynchophorus ferrugineus]|uniref:Uncharacterized protein n=1 Tax=Rhynchophorus ferrugineus TaxID=354439 RepID=A0A834MI28_RHYFE|nr:hypothetical protein GWI33_022067 [Rhynchophorus ferrugineus]
MKAATIIFLMLFCVVLSLPAIKDKDDDDVSTQSGFNQPLGHPKSSISRSSDDLDTAEAVIFRPLFVYRKYVVKRRRYNRN